MLDNTGHVLLYHSRPVDKIADLVEPRQELVVLADPLTAALDQSLRLLPVQSQQLVERLLVLLDLLQVAIECAVHFLNKAALQFLVSS